MQNLQISNNGGSYTNAVELIMIDEQKRERRAVIFFNVGDEWRDSEGYTDVDIESVFAGAIMQVAKNDKSAIAYKATSYTILNNMVKKSISFNPIAKKMTIAKDGNLIFEMVDILDI